MYKVYEIKSGHHSSGIHFGLNLTNDVSKTISFASNCEYQLPATNQADINKAYGFSQGYHMQNSCRIGWKYVDSIKGIELVAYCHIDGKIYDIENNFSNCHLNYCDFSQSVDCKISIDWNTREYIFVINGIVSKKILLSPKLKFKYGYNLYPYFGGGCTAPHTMTIDLSKA